MTFLSEAAATADYSSIVQIALWARTLRDLYGSLPSAKESHAVVALERSSKIGTKIAVRERSPRAHSASYPRFCQRDDQLIRVAWSRKEKKEYRHKASFATLKAVINAMSKHGADGRVFSTEEILPIHDSTDGGKVPDYQAYVVISLLKETGLIDPHGRRGYSIPRITQFEDAVEAVWKKLPAA
jgi:hypothetical protein